jgi:hypothetical protein
LRFSQPAFSLLRRTFLDAQKTSRSSATARSRQAIPVPAFTFWQQVLLNFAGPLATALFVGIGAALVLRRAQNRREDAAIRLERLREDHELRDRLISQAIEVPSALYLATQHYLRAKDEHLPSDQLAMARAEVDARYLASRREGLVLEYRLGLHFAEKQPRRLSHRLMDLLTIRYFELVHPDGASLDLRNKNAGDAHSGLTAEELAVPAKVLDKYDATIEELVDALAGGTLLRVDDTNSNLRAAR